MGADGAAFVREHAQADLLAVVGAVGADEVHIHVALVALPLSALEVLLELEFVILVLDAVVLAHGLVALVHVVVFVVVLVLVLPVLVLVLDLVLALLAGHLALVLLGLHLGLGVHVEEVIHPGEVPAAVLAAVGGADGELDGVVGDEATEIIFWDGEGGVARFEPDLVLVHPGDILLLVIVVVVAVSAVLVEVTNLVAANVLGVAHQALGGADGLGAAVELAVGAAAGDGGDGEEEGSDGELHLGWVGVWGGLTS